MSAEEAFVWTPNWTQDASGRENSSALFLALIDEVARLIRNSAYDLIAGRSEVVARTILAHLAHTHGMKPDADVTP